MSAAQDRDGDTAVTPEGPNAALASGEALITRGFVGRPWPAISLATVVGLTCMNLTILVGLPIFVSVFALIGGILLVLGYRAGDMTFNLSEEGLYRRFRPLINAVRRQPEREQFFRFSEMRSYQREDDWSRYRGEVESLKIKLARPPYRVRIHDIINREDFQAFADRFERLAEAASVVRKPGFYRTIWSKLVAFGFTAMAVVLIGFMFAGMLSPTSVFKLLIVIVPGVAYMLYRIFSPRRGLRQRWRERSSETDGEPESADH